MRKMKKMGVLLVCLMMITSFLAACSGNSSSKSDEVRVLRIATAYGDEFNEGIRSQYTDLFAFDNKNIEVEVVSAINWREYDLTRDPDEPYEEIDEFEAMKELIQGDTPPDVVIADVTILEKLIQENLLTSLDPLISKDNIDLEEEYVPGIINGLRDIGNGQLYGLSPTFSPRALVYNATLLSEANVPLPEDNMTWDEIFNLARQVSNAFANDDEPRYGFAFQTYSWNDMMSNLETYTAGLDLQIVDDAGEKMMVNSDAWRNAIETLIELDEDKVLAQEPEWDMMDNWSRYTSDHFLSGRAAMVPISYSYIQEIATTMRLADRIKGFEPFDWDVVTYPVHAENPDVGGQMYMDSIFAIPANAQNPDDAWKFVKFVNGEDWARLKAKSSYNMVSRKDFIEPPAGAEHINISAFYQLKPAPITNNFYSHPNVPQMYRVTDILWQLFWDYEQGLMTVDELLAEWETRGNQTLQEIKEGGGDGGFDVMPMPMPIG